MGVDRGFKDAMGTNIAIILILWQVFGSPWIKAISGRKCILVCEYPNDENKK